MKSRKERARELMNELLEVIFEESESIRLSDSTPRAVETKEDKKEEKKEVKKDKKEGKAFTRANPAKTPAEIKEFHAQWEELSKDDQEAFIRGEIDSLGNAIEAKEEKKEEKKEKKEKAKKEEKKEKKEKAKKEEKKEEPSITAAQVREFVIQFAKDNGDQEAIKLLKSVGASKISEIPEEKFAEVLAYKVEKEDESIFG